MATRHRPVTPRTRSLGSLLATPLIIAGVLFLGLALYTVINGELRLPFGGGVLFAFQKEKKEVKQGPPPLPKGTVAVLACPRPLPAFTKLTREHLLTKDGLHRVPVVEEAIAPNGLFRADIEGLTGLLGRVLRRAKPVNFAFTEGDLLPKGTRGGPHAGIPPGRRGVWLDFEKVQGLSGAQAGDLVDLIAAAPGEAAPVVNTSVLGNLTDPVLKARFETMAVRGATKTESRSWVIARGALIINPMRSRELANTGGKNGKPTIVEEAFLAMAPNEVSLFSQALAKDVTILAAPRSAQPESHPTEIPDSKPVDVQTELRKLLTGDEGSPPSFGMIEMIRGGQRQTVTVPRAAAAEQGKR